METEGARRLQARSAAVCVHVEPLGQGAAVSAGAGPWEDAGVDVCSGGQGLSAADPGPPKQIKKEAGDPEFGGAAPQGPRLSL